MTSDARCRGPVVRTRGDARRIACRKVWNLTRCLLRSSQSLAVIFRVGRSLITGMRDPVSAQPYHRPVAETLQFAIAREAEWGGVPSYGVLTESFGTSKTESVPIHTGSGMTRRGSREVDS